jgi:4-aminobutyrate aminotransferase-like enzyme
MLSAGPAGNVLQLAPPLVIDRAQLAFSLDIIDAALRRAAA